MQIEIFKTSFILLLGSCPIKKDFVEAHFGDSDIIDLNNEMSMLEDILKNLQEKFHQNGLIILENVPLNYTLIKQLTDLASDNYYFPFAFLFDSEKSVANIFPDQPKISLRHIKKEFEKFYFFRSAEEAKRIKRITKKPFPGDFSRDKGPFDIIGDVHGCFSELKTLILKLGYKINYTEENNNIPVEITHPENRKLVFVGDLVDRGPNSPAVLNLVMSACAFGKGYCVPGNHDDKLMRKLKGREVQVKHGLERTMEQLSIEPASFGDRVKAFFEKLPSHLILDGGNLVIAHAGIKEAMIGKSSEEVLEFCLYGETTGESDDFGIPIRVNWAENYSGDKTIVYGHTPVREASVTNKTIDVDTGCVFGGTLTALRYPEMEFVFVKAEKCYYKLKRAFSEEV